MWDWWKCELVWPAGWCSALTCSPGLRSVYSEPRVMFGLSRCFLHSLIISELMGSWLLTVGCSLNSCCSSLWMDTEQRKKMENQRKSKHFRNSNSVVVVLLGLLLLFLFSHHHHLQTGSLCWPHGLTFGELVRVGLTSPLTNRLTSATNCWKFSLSSAYNFGLEFFLLLYVALKLLGLHPQS